MEEQWKTTKEVYNETAQKVLGYKKRNRKPWISDKTWESIDERRLLKSSVEEAKSERIRNKKSDEYAEKAKEVKRRLRQDKRDWADGILVLKLGVFS